MDLGNSILGEKVSRSARKPKFDFDIAGSVGLTHAGNGGLIPMYRHPFHLGPMNLVDTTDCSKGYLGFGGRADTIFSEDAIKVIHQASHGYPRTVTNLVVAALTAARSMQSAIVDQSAVTEFTE
ncbi:hypothetical protein [Glutamicibacter creatinolyticus]|uniref:hypothetical protein n=1 Tax=Glutamicibacter creatinolyticus TaxID=162496 RepID=UPI0037BF0C07